MKRGLRASGRAIAGFAIIGIAVAGTATLAVIPLPVISVESAPIEIDTVANSMRTLVCPGAFGELGADPSQPGVAVPSGETEVLVTGEPTEITDLSREIVSGTPSQALSAATADPLSAAQSQLVNTANLQGLTAAACIQPANVQWLVGGATKLGMSTTLNIGNPAKVPATVQISVFDEQGGGEISETTGVLVPAESQRVVSLNGYAPNREHLAVKVESTGAAVAASLEVSQTVEIRSYAVETVTSQREPKTQLLIPAVTNVSTHTHAAGEGAHDTEDFPVVVRVLSPGLASGTAKITALFPDGASELLGEISFGENTVAALTVGHWPEAAQAIQIDADAPVVAGAFGTADVPPQHDYAWFTPAPLIEAGVPVPLTVLNGQLSLANPGSAEADITVIPEVDGADPVEITVPAGGAVTVTVPMTGTLQTNQPIAAGVRLLAGSYIASYPIIAPSERAGTMVVYTR